MSIYERKPLITIRFESTQQEIRIGSRKGRQVSSADSPICFDMRRDTIYDLAGRYVQVVDPAVHGENTVEVGEFVGVEKVSGTERFVSGKAINRDSDTKKVVIYKKP